MKCSFNPYEGNEPYIFVSYAHKDSAAVFSIIEKLNERGFRIWYDEGIELGSEWPEDIANHIDKCSALIAFHSSNSVKSNNCRHEINFAIEGYKDILSIYLEKVELTRGMKMQLSSFQSTNLYEYNEDEVYKFYERLFSTRVLQPCKNVRANKIVPIILMLGVSGNLAESDDFYYAVLAMIQSFAAASEKNTAYEIAIILFSEDAYCHTEFTDARNLKELPPLKYINSIGHKDSNSHAEDLRIVSDMVRRGIIPQGSKALSLIVSLQNARASTKKSYYDFRVSGMCSIGKAIRIAKNMIKNLNKSKDSCILPTIILISDDYKTYSPKENFENRDKIKEKYFFTNEPMLIIKDENSKNPLEDYKETLADFISDKLTSKCRRISIGIGDKVDFEALAKFATDVSFCINVKDESFIFNKFKAAAALIITLETPNGKLDRYLI